MTAAGSADHTDLEILLGLLDLEQLGEDHFLGHHPEKVMSRTFGGQLVGQAIVAASRTVGAGRPLHCVNVHFIRGGDVKAPIEFRVDRHRDGRAIANRVVTGYQGKNEVFTMLAAFQDYAKGLEHGIESPDVPTPDTLATLEDHFVGYEEVVPHFINALRPIDMRYANAPAWVMKGTGEQLDHNRVWMKAVAPLPDDPTIHAAVLAYSSDTTILDSIITRHGLSWGHDRILAATLNHSIWFHRPVRFDEWALYSTQSPVAAGSRGLSTGHFFSASGALLATTVQEGVIRHYPKR